MRLSEKDLVEYSKRYDLHYANSDDRIIENDLKNYFKLHRYLDKEHFIKLCLWKSKRPKKQYENNDELTIKEITQFSLSTISERARIEALTILSGVSYPVASVILHFAFPDEYSILDFRAIWSLDIEEPKKYDFAFWQKYTSIIQEIANRNKLEIRTLDKALWEYSKIYQK